MLCKKWHKENDGGRRGQKEDFYKGVIGLELPISGGETDGQTCQWWTNC